MDPDADRHLGCAAQTYEDDDVQKLPSPVTRAVLAAAAALLLSGCESAALGPDPLSSPTPAQAPSFVGAVDVDAVLRAMHPGQAVDPAQREQLRGLVAAMSELEVEASRPAAPPAVSASAERALREMRASPGDTAAMLRALELLVAEHRADPR
jgi:hypothetical protein